MKYLWNMVNLLQFVVFMRIWQILIPPKADIFLEQLKSLALFEFLPTDKIRDAFKGMVGSKEEKCEECVDPTAKDPPISEKLAVFLIVAITIFLVLVLLLLLKYLIKVCPKL